MSASKHFFIVYRKCVVFYLNATRLWYWIIGFGSIILNCDWFYGVYRFLLGLGGAYFALTSKRKFFRGTVGYYIDGMSRLLIGFVFGAFELLIFVAIYAEQRPFLQKQSQMNKYIKYGYRFNLQHSLN